MNRDYYTAEGDNGYSGVIYDLSRAVELATGYGNGQVTLWSRDDHNGLRSRQVVWPERGHIYIRHVEWKVQEKRPPCLEPDRCDGSSCVRDIACND